MGDVRTALLPLVTDTCPAELRQVVTEWKAGRCSNQALIEASYIAQLDLLEAYRRKPPPSVPDEVAQHRAMPPYKRDQLSADAKEALERRHVAFFAQERQVTRQNQANRYHVSDLLDWATERQLPASVLSQIEGVLHEHDDTEAPFVVGPESATAELDTIRPRRLRGRDGDLG